MKLNQKEFEERINNIQQVMNRVNNSVKYQWLKKDIGTLINNLIDSLEVMCYDYEGWIKWYIFETEFGTKDYKAVIFGKTQNVKNIERLYKLIEYKYNNYKRYLKQTRIEYYND